MKRSHQQLAASRSVAKQAASAIVPLFFLFGLPVVSKIGTNDVTLKVGGAESAKITLRIDKKTVNVGQVDLDWQRKPEVGLMDDSIILGADWPRFYPARPGWCEIWIGDELCDREETGHTCSCDWHYTSWPGEINGQRSQRTSVR
jgi:hypothetical protein